MDDVSITIQLIIVLVFSFFALSGLTKCELIKSKQKDTMQCLEKQMADFDKCEVLRK